MKVEDQNDNKVTDEQSDRRTYGGVLARSNAGKHVTKIDDSHERKVSQMPR